MNQEQLSSSRRLLKDLSKSPQIDEITLDILTKWGYSYASVSSVGSPDRFAPSFTAGESTDLLEHTYNNHEIFK
ncbi:hypothetical protein M0R88_10415 [Halorussus gelatinilyticus]|uniref:Uncharacterized protein n=1 Tax=Halorussus gelatinilyticus TaxID=2937524 RepID=A0A8U0IDB8_9EURY|nr:hypothetical protein [Halorussus gelatinilyticus]UPV98942.1 hypothetical protein M0R88_10415 [Halorussus gelatinilyticus]